MGVGERSGDGEGSGGGRGGEGHFHSFCFFRSLIYVLTISTSAFENFPKLEHFIPG